MRQSIAGWIKTLLRDRNECVDAVNGIIDGIERDRKLARSAKQDHDALSNRVSVIRGDLDDLARRVDTLDDPEADGAAATYALHLEERIGRLEAVANKILDQLVHSAKEDRAEHRDAADYYGRLGEHLERLREKLTPAPQPPDGQPVGG